MKEGKPILLGNIDKSYGHTVVMEGLSLELPASGVVALLGTSGCGKTTLLHLLAGLERPQQGSIAGLDDKAVSMVFQEERLIDVISARENILAVLPEGERTIADLCLEHCGLLESAGMYSREMSGGMRRRVAIARAMAFQGDILLLDEPLKGLDVATRERVMNFLFKKPVQGLRKPSLTLVVLHDVEEAMQVADRVLVCQGPPLRIVDQLDLPDPKDSCADFAIYKQRIIDSLSYMTKYI